MKYMLMMHAPKEGWTTAGIGTWAPEDIKAHIAFMIGFNKKLQASGEFVDAQGLAGPEEAKSARRKWSPRGRSSARCGARAPARTRGRSGGSVRLLSRGRGADRQHAGARIPRHAGGQAEAR